MSNKSSSSLTRLELALWGAFLGHAQDPVGFPPIGLSQRPKLCYKYSIVSSRREPNEPVGGIYELVYHQPLELSTYGRLFDRLLRLSLINHRMNRTKKVAVMPSPG